MHMYIMKALNCTTLGGISQWVYIIRYTVRYISMWIRISHARTTYHKSVRYGIGTYGVLAELICKNSFAYWLFHAITFEGKVFSKIHELKSKKSL